ncbi:MAG: hypothetical protein QXP36_05405 [Conexivisphaerales archaeon]
MTNILTLIIEVLNAIPVPVVVTFGLYFINFISKPASKKKALHKLYCVSKTFREHFTSGLTPLYPSEFLKSILAAVLVIVFSAVGISILILKVPMQSPPLQYVLAMIILIWIFIMTFIPIFLKIFLKNSTSDKYQNHLIDYLITSMGRYALLSQFLLLAFMVIIFSINIPSFSINMPSLLFMSLIAVCELAFILYLVFIFYKLDYYKPLSPTLANIFKDNFTNTHKHAIYIAVITKYGNHKDYKGRVLDIDKYLVIETDEGSRIPIDWHAIESIELVKEK